MNVPALLASGALSGILMGMVGIGGGAILVPLLLMSGLSLYKVLCVVLFIQLVPQTLPALWVYYKKGEFPMKESLIVVASSAIGAALGAYIVTRWKISSRILYRLIAVSLVGFGAYTWYAHSDSDE